MNGAGLEEKIKKFWYWVGRGVVLPAIIIACGLIVAYGPKILSPHVVLISLIVGASMVLTVAIANSVRERDAQKKRERLLPVLDGLSSILRFSSLLSETELLTIRARFAKKVFSDVELANLAADLTCRKFYEQLNDFHHHEQFFIRLKDADFFHPTPQRTTPHDIIIARQFCDDIEYLFVKRNIHKPLAFSTQRFVFPTITARVLGTTTVSYETEKSAPFFRIHEVEARHDFGGDHCLVLPMPIHEFQRNPAEPLLGYIGIVDDKNSWKFILDEMIRLTDDFELLYHHLKKEIRDLYYQLKKERLTLSVDGLLNRSRVNLLQAAPQEKITTLFARQFQDILRDEFSADDVKVWLKGMPVDEHTAAFANANDEPRLHGNRLSCAIVLDETPLGWIAMWRDKVEFSRIDIQLLRSTETQIDQYVRDLWEEQVIREIDHEVFNKSPLALEEFAGKLIKELVHHFDACGGVLQVHHHEDAAFVSSDDLAYDERGKVERLLAALGSALRSGDRVSATDSPDGGYYRLLMRLSIDEQPLGAILLLGKNRFTRIHREGLKRLEAQVDNILKLYMNFEEHVRGVKN